MVKKKENNTKDQEINKISLSDDLNHDNSVEIPKQDSEESKQVMPEHNPKSTHRGKIVKKVGVILLILLLLFIGLGIFAYVQVKAVMSSAHSTLDSAQAVYDAGKNQDLITANSSLEEVKVKLSQTQGKFKAMSWIGFVPVAGRYWHDGDHALTAAQAGVEAADIFVDAVEPYADVLGFSGQGSFMGGTAEDRIVKVVETLDKVTPQLDEVGKRLETVTQQLDQIDPERYQFTYQGRQVDETISQAQEVAHGVLFAVTTAKPAFEQLPKMMGVEEERKYMVMFQNDAELRATGGFMTAYAILRVEKGKVFQEKSEDIYTLDNKFNSSVPAPEIIRKYLPLVYRQYLRDINLSPDFKISMDAFSFYYNDLPGEPDINGIIAVDTQVLRDIIEVLGPIEVPGYGTFSAEIDDRCDCPQVIYELELLADRPTATLRENRKGVLAPMFQSILFKAYGSPKQQWPDLLEAVISNINEKHVLFYMYDAQQQEAAEKINIAGRIRNFDGDYFHLNDTNFAGAKSNMFTDNEVEHVYEVQDDGSLVKTVTIKYQNPFPPSNCNLEAGELCLNGTLRNVARVYVPEGSELIEALGSELEVETKDELGKTMFEAFFTLQPESQAKLVLKYKLPMKAEDELKLLIQKQPGKRNPKHTIDTSKSTQVYELLSDKEITVDL